MRDFSLLISYVNEGYQVFIMLHYFEPRRTKKMFEQVEKLTFIILEFPKPDAKVRGLFAKFSTKKIAFEMKKGKGIDRNFYPI